ncbi:MAG TPA: methyltransferase domain-containing protein [Solirubrobacteraceae bacterium]|nr:methyltransferase domain-containing protein [Solirubrobacteraceae bacterium]
MHDADAYRQESRRGWGSVAEAWARHADRQVRAVMPVSARMLDAARLQPGAQVLDLAAGTGDLGFMAHELIQPGGTLITSDFAPEMLTAAQERAAALGLRDVRFKQIDYESIDLAAASLDAVLCRWGLMFAADANAALRECRRVLRPGGRLALAAWASPDENPWVSAISRELVPRGLMDAPDPSLPGQFAWARPGLIEELLAEAGFVDDIEVEAVDFEFDDEDFEGWWDRTLDMSRSGRVIAALPEGEREELRAALQARLARYEREDGVLALPARSWVAAASA